MTNRLDLTDNLVINTERKTLSLVELIVLFIVFIRFCDPLNLVLTTTGVYGIYYGLYFIFLFLVLLNKSNYILEVLKYTWILIIFILMIGLRSYYSGNIGFGFSDPMKMILLFINMIIACSVYFYVKDKNTKFKRKVVLAAIAGLIISILYSSYYVTFIDYLAVRNATAVHLGVGDFNLIYALMFIPIIVFMSVNQLNSKRLRLYLLFIYIISVYLLIQANFMTAIIIFLVSTALSLLASGSNSGPKKFFASFLAFILALFLIIFKKSIGLFIISIAQKDIFSWVINNKLIVIGELIMGTSNDTETLGIRMEKIKYTLSTFFENPIFGVNYANYNADTVGGHAQWFDELARFGIIGFILLIYFYFKLYRKSIIDTNLIINKNIIRVSWIVFIVIGFLNPNTMSTVTMMLFAIIPFCGQLNNAEKGKGEL